MNTKVCKGICGLERDIIEFGKRRKNKDGYNNICKWCEGRYGKREDWAKRQEAKKLLECGFKICNGCQEMLTVDKFGFKSNGRLLGRCKICSNEYSRIFYATNKENVSKKRKLKKNKMGEKEKLEIAWKNHQYYLQNKKQILKKTNYYKRNNKDKRLEYENKIEVKLANKVRKRIKRALKNNVKLGKIYNFIGCTVEKLKQHLEQKFYSHKETGEEMTWGNYGFYGWHLDHVIPLGSFDLTNRKQLLKACHYTNLQPLWAEENLRKSDKINWRK